MFIEKSYICNDAIMKTFQKQENYQRHDILSSLNPGLHKNLYSFYFFIDI